MTPKKSKGVGIVIEFAERGPLRQFIRTSGYTEKQGLKVMQDIACGLSYLHSFPNPILHLSISEHSVMVTQDLTGKISDTGEFNRTHLNDVYSSTGGSGGVGRPFKRHGITSVAPELLRGEDGTVASDAYSLGMCIYYVVFRKGPWEGINGDSQHGNASGVDDGTVPEQVLAEIASGQATIKFPEQQGIQCDERIKKLVSSLSAPSPGDRMLPAKAMDLLSDIRGVVRRLER